MNQEIIDFIENIQKRYDINKEIFFDQWNKIMVKCPYKFVRGKRKGEYCNKKSMSGAMYCSLHKKYEDVGDKTVVLKKGSPLDKTHIIRKNKEIGKLCHEQTGFVFKSIDDKVVIGRLVNGVVEKLTDDDIEQCKHWRFKIDKKIKESDFIADISESIAKKESSELDLEMIIDDLFDDTEVVNNSLGISE